MIWQTFRYGHKQAQYTDHGRTNMTHWEEYLRLQHQERKFPAAQHNKTLMKPAELCEPKTLHLIVICTQLTG